MTLERRTPLRRSRKPLPRIGRKARRERAALDVARVAVKARARGYCEGRGFSPLCTGVGVEAHHVWPEDRDAGRHDPERMRWLCRMCHHEAHHRGGRSELLRPEVNA